MNLLRSALLRLGAIGVITVGIDLLINRKAVDKSVTGFLRSNGLGGFTGGTKNFSTKQEAVAWALLHASDGGLNGQLAAQILAAADGDVTTAQAQKAASLFQTGPLGFTGQSPAAAPTTAKTATLFAGSGASGAAAAVTRDQATATALARAQAEGTKAQIVAAAKARLAFINDTIAFANKLIASGRGNTKQLEDTLQSFYGAEASTQDIIDQINQEAADARKAKLDAANAAAKKRQDDYAKGLAEAKRLQEQDLQQFRTRIKDEEDAALARRQEQASLQDQLLENARLAAELIPNEKKRIARERAVQRDVIALDKYRLSLLKKGTLEYAQARGELLSAELAYRNIGKDATKKEKAAGGGFSLQDLFGEADREFAMYGSNIGPRGTPLSGQDARAAFAGVVKTHQTIVVQHFNYPVSASQALNDAKAGAVNLK